MPKAGAAVKQNGLLTQGEDTADNGGLHLALSALEEQLKKEGKSLDDKTSERLDFTANNSSFLYAFFVVLGSSTRGCASDCHHQPSFTTDFPYRQCRF